MANTLIEIDDDLSAKARVPDNQAERRLGAFDQIDARPYRIASYQGLFANYRCLATTLSRCADRLRPGGVGCELQGEGYVYVAKATARANLTVTLVPKLKFDKVSPK